MPPQYLFALLVLGFVGVGRPQVGGHGVGPLAVCGQALGVLGRRQNAVERYHKDAGRRLGRGATVRR